MPCRRKSVKEKKKERKGKKMRAKHQKHGHPRLMTAMQRCLHNRFNAECISLRVSPSCLGIYKVAAVSVIRDEGSPRILSATFSVAKQLFQLLEPEWFEKTSLLRQVYVDGTGHM
jgi:hypothetical protein